MSNALYTAIIIATIAVVTVFFRSGPFIIFRKENPSWLIYLSKVLPSTVIPVLLVFSLKDVDIRSMPYGLPEIICIAFVALIYKWKHSSIISIISGTVVYMLLVQKVF